LSKAGDQVPVIPLFEVVGKAVKAVPSHTAGTAVNVGVTFGLTVMVIVVVVAHCPTAGVKVYVVVAAVFKAGDQVPVIPLLEVVGKAANAPPEQIAGTAVNVGVIVFGFTVMVIVVVVAHNPAVGVNVYVVVAVLFRAGDQVPVIPFVEVVGKAAKVDPVQIAGTAVNVGVTFEFTVRFKVVDVAQAELIGINV
jgi:hypothetical protein